jgi:hypothetical protein
MREFHTGAKPEILLMAKIFYFFNFILGCKGGNKFISHAI